MATSSIYELLPAFKERNQVIFMLLGLLSLNQEWMEMLEAQASEKRLSAKSRLSDHTDESMLDEAEKGFLYFLLGTVSFSHNLRATLESARLNGEASRSQPRPQPGWEDTHDLLR